MNYVFTGLALGALVTLAACAPQPVRLTTAFNPSEVEFVRTPGTATVTGQAFMRQRGGGVVTCAGADVRMAPVTAYSSERINLIYGNTQRGTSGNMSRQPEQAPPGYETASLLARCDAQGNFRFERVPAGEFFLLTSVRWEVPSGYVMQQQGGHLMQRVSTAPGQTQSVVLSN